MTLRLHWFAGVRGGAGVWAIVSLLSSPAVAQIVPDETLGGERSQLGSGTVRGQAVDRIEGSAQRGQNLFHSFREFNVRDGQRVYFNNPADVSNILTRVTGNTLSKESQNLPELNRK